MKDRRIDDYLNEGESIVWSGKAKENDYITCRLINMLPVLCIWLALELIVLSFTVVKNVYADFSTYYMLLVIGAIVLHAVPTTVWIVGVARENVRLAGEQYALTDSRLLIMRSEKHESIESVDLKDVTDIRLKRTLAEYMMSTGKIVFIAGDDRVELNGIENADKVFKKIYRAVMAGDGADE